jgi:Ulp1 family protease
MNKINSTWTFSNAKNVPQQRTSNDCSVFLLMFANCIIREKQISFGWQNILFCRKLIVYEIMMNWCF